MTVAGTVADQSGNQLGADDTWSFTTAPHTFGFTDTTVGDFGGGSPDANTYVSQTDNGELILKPTEGQEFSGGPGLPAGWSSGNGAPWTGGTATVSGSPSSDNFPLLKGTAPAGSTVTLYQSADCSGPPQSQGSAADFASPGLAGGVDDNTTSQFSATATDPAGNTSACSAPFTYVENSSPPRRPDDHRLGPGQPLERQLPAA